MTERDERVPLRGSAVTLEDYAPGGTLRVAINHGNVILAGRDSAGAPKGISVDLAYALAQELGSVPKFVEFDRALDVSSRAEADVWDLCFLAVDPDRAQVIGFSQPYVRIEGNYLVAERTGAIVPEDVVEQGLKIGVVEGSAYALHLSRARGAEGLVNFPSLAAAKAALAEGAVDGLAGIRQAMEAVAAMIPGTHVVGMPFMEIRQAMGVPATRIRAHTHLSEFLARRARDGTVARILEAHGVDRACAVMPDDQGIG
ncbi:MAG TPA: transporter substrate-binding domain-containing protein [Paracoccus sp. (in: a-proteobacteria)]|uniref:transporter substrate-binding domain-containing protein n=1 Tax=Paracoccus sp. TaxID=267 RepID=UPI002BFC277C|nr:transporter substrate-binding domain-containing protein [Paracoccus sp. (in: a-proteobacteria)]HWL56597.1 transporter substrate-binding domain-containing protein [Paracoccus sp. (in: a-proteobacteria)]